MSRESSRVLVLDMGAAQYAQLILAGDLGDVLEPDVTPGMTAGRRGTSGRA